MDTIINTLLSSDFLKFALPIAGATIAWFWNERRKVRWEQVQRKEERYRELLRCLKGFYVSSEDAHLKTQFIEQIGLCWLYAPDEVIQKANAFIDSIITSRIPLATDEEKEQALGELVLAVRKDMLSRTLVTTTSLSHTDWKNFNV